MIKTLEEYTEISIRKRIKFHQEKIQKLYDKLKKLKQKK